MELARTFLGEYSFFRINEISGRYLSYRELAPVLDSFRSAFIIEKIGQSFLNVPIESIKVGTGKTKILAWSQMHGNETTTTKGLLDLLNFFMERKNQDQLDHLFSKITILFIPMLNPDGAARYTRENVNGTDLNRDAMELKEPESRVLRKCFENFKPDFCFNLHDQRTIFGVDKEPATLSFLAPSMDMERKITPVREKAMKLIAAMNIALQELIPGQVGRFDDSFNINCTGDYFQAKEVPTVLFECGHFPEDYMREITRKFFAYALLVALENIYSEDYLTYPIDQYHSIPENKKIFYDVILRNAIVKGQKVDVALQYKEMMKSGEIHFLPEVQTMAPKLSSLGHMEINCDGEVKNIDEQELSENDIVEAILLNKEKLSIKSH